MRALLLTLPELCRQAGISLPSGRLYADAGLIDCFRDTRGNRLFLETAVEEARAVKKRRQQRTPVPTTLELRG